MQRPRIPLAACALALVAACGGSKPAPRPKTAHAVAPPKASSAPPPASPAPPPFPVSHGLAAVPAGTFGPYVARAGEHLLALWSAPGDGGRRWTAMPLASDGTPSGPARDAGPAPDSAPRVVVRPVRDGFVAVVTYAVDRSSAVAAIALSTSGEPRGGPQIVTQTADAVPYADVVDFDAGFVALFASQKKDRADLVAVPLDHEAKPKGNGTVVAADVLAWEPVALDREAAIGVVRRVAKGDDAAGGQVAVARFGADGKPIGEPRVVSPAPTADPDLDAVRVGDRIVLAWTDRRDLDSHVYVAATDRAGAVVVAPHPATPPRGEQAFVALVPPNPVAPAPVALLAWEDLAERTSGPDLPAGARAIRLATLGSEASLGSRTATLAFASGSRDVPDLAVAADGFAATTLAPACEAGERCGALAPTAVRFDRELGVVGSEPLRATAFPRPASDGACAEPGGCGGGAASIAWGLSCGASHCTTLAAGATIPSAVLAVEIPIRKSVYSAAASVDRPAAGPHAVAVDAVAKGDHLADVATAAVGDRTLVAWVTYFVEGSAAPAPKRAAKDAKKGSGERPGDPKRPRAATVAVRAIDAKGAAVGKETVVSIRGASVGGVALAAGAPAERDACLAWVARDEGDLQVFATRVDADGKKLAQKMITRAKGDASDVAVAWAGDGWLLAWVDTRDGNGEVYATKLDRSLARVLPERRLTTAPGDASDVRLLVRGDEVWVAWADRVDTRDGAPSADPFVARLATSDLSPRGEAVRVAATSLHSRAPELAEVGGGVVLGWIEDPRPEATAADAGGAGAMLVRLDPHGRPIGAPSRVPLAAPATSLALSCDGDACRGIASVAADEALRFEAFRWSSGAPSAGTPLLTLSGAASEDVVPSIVGDVVYFADDDVGGRGRVRRMHVAWR